MPRPITAVIHHDALQNNLSIAREMAPDSQVFAVVKANAYGHGIERVYSSFKTADGFALLDIEEAKRIRALGWTGAILLLEGIFSAQDLFDCDQYNLSFTVHSQHQIDWIQQYAVIQNQQDQKTTQFDIFLKMNSGMNRLGFNPEHYQAAWHQLNSLNSIHSITHMMHFSDADGDRFGESGIDYQHTIFEETIKDLGGERSLCNSAAILRYSKQLHSEYIRSGIMLYGSSPDYPTHSIDDWNLKPSMSLRSEIIAIQHLEANQTVGYGSRFIATHSMKIGIVACGYADGYQRISMDAPILVNDVRTRTIGRVSMDMLAVDLTNIPNAEIGSEVVLWGQSAQGTVLAIDDVAASSGTVGYELMCGITARVPFVSQTHPNNKGQ